jgi:hypothetical protein
MRNWQDAHDIIGDAFTDALGRIRYCMPTADGNRARWPTHELWRHFEAVVGNDLLQNCAGVLPSYVMKANRAAKMRELDAQLAGLFVTRAAISDVSADSFSDFLESHSNVLARLVAEHTTPLKERLAKARRRYQLS